MIQKFLHSIKAKQIYFVSKPVSSESKISFIYYSTIRHETLSSFSIKHFYPTTNVAPLNAKCHMWVYKEACRTSLKENSLCTFRN